MLPYVAADLAGVVLEVGLFGIYTVLFGVCIWVIVNKKSIHPLLSISAVLSFTLSLVYVALDLRRVAQGFAFQPNPTIAIYTASPQHAGTLSTVITSAYVTNSIIADSVLIWRCFSVWNRSTLVILPSIVLLLWAGTTGYATVYYLQTSSLNSVLRSAVAWWGKASMAAVIATNVITTSLIASRIWWQKRNIERAFGDRAKHTEYYNAVIAIVIESGALYTCTVICELVVFVMDIPALLVILVSALSQIAGIMPTLIIVWAALGKTLHPTTDAGPRSIEPRSGDNLAIETVHTHRHRISPYPYDLPILFPNSHDTAVSFPQRRVSGDRDPLAK